MRYAGASRIEASFRRLSSHRRLGSGAARRLCAGAASRLQASVCRLSSPSRPVQRRGEAAVRWTAARLGGCAPAPPLDSRQLCAGAACRLRRPSVASRLIAVWTAARPGGYVPAPPLDSKRPSIASRLCRRQYSGAVRSVSVAVWTAARRGSHALDSGAAMRLCAGAASRLGASARCLSSRSPPEQRRGEQLCARQRRC